MIKKLYQNDSLGGGSNTPLEDTIDVHKKTLDKRVLIDWLSATFDFILIENTAPRYYKINTDDKQFQRLLEIFHVDNINIKCIKPEKKPKNGYSEMLQISEHIFLLYGGEHTKNSKGLYSAQLLMSGQACREYENILNGSWYELLQFLISHGSNIKRIDIAIDDFTANEIDIYKDIKPMIENKHFVSPMHKWIIYHSGYMNSTDGFSITLGSPGSNQLQMYDKRLERNARNEIDLDTDIWYRYEMRFVDEKALSVTMLYITAVEDKNSEQFMEFASSVLYSVLDLKKYKLDINISRWKTHPKWLSFLNVIKKIKIETQYKIDSTIESKMLWKTRSIAMVDFKIDFARHDSYVWRDLYRAKNDLLAISKFKDEDFAEVNNYRKMYNLPLRTNLDLLEWEKDINNQIEERGNYS